MNSNRKNTIIAGVLIIVGMIAGVFSIVPVVDEPDFLHKISSNENQVFIGAFFQFIMIPAYIGFALSLYPILRKHNEGLAIGFVGFRMIAGMFHFIGVIILPLFLILGQEFIKAGTPDPSYFQILGDLLRAGRDLVNHVAMILALSLGGLMLFYILYQSKLLPRWLAGWGFIGTTLTMLASLLILFRLIDVITPIYLVLNLPLALQEIILAVWLIVKGFNSSTIVSESENQM
jgi:hypothetical protein